MKLFSILFIPTIVIFGTLVSFGDIRSSKIKNIHIVWGIFCTVILNLLLLIILKLRIIEGFENFLLMDYYIAFFLNIFISIFIALLLWYLDLWAAGDAKFFIVLSALLPLVFYEHEIIKYFPGFTFLFNIYIPVFLYIFLKSIFLFLRNGLIKLRKFSFSKSISTFRPTKKTFIYFSLLFLFVMLSNFFANIFSEVRYAGLLVFVLPFLFYSHLQKLLLKFKIVPYLIFVLFVLFVYLVKIAIFDIFVSIFIFMILINFLKIFVSDFLEENELKSVERSDLREGMILSREYMKII